MSAPLKASRTTEELAAIAREGRWRVLETVSQSGAGHIGGPLSAMDLLVSLYWAQLRIDPKTPGHPDRDRFILSKGHCSVGLYAVLAMRGFFPVAELASFDHAGSRLQGHPDMLLTPGVDASTGSLGQGLSVGMGMAVAAKRRGQRFHTWVLCGDGELQEGMIWEAVLSAPRFGLDNLTLIVDLNGLQQYGWPASEGDRFDRSEPLGHLDLEAVFRGFGWGATVIDGHDFHEILPALEHAQARGDGRPHAIIARTQKGHGVSFTAGTIRWHNGVATSEQLDLARRELGQPEEVHA